ncbi:hypothetical protein DL96DRAFT_1801670 [Flagelloscypha sp. PMI_526]|nr:hypothetical protein DL96DRAFT_1801670 [Flagelloscypha sp. PMI_526]
MAYASWKFCAVHASDAEVGAGSSFEMTVGSIGPAASNDISTAISTRASIYWRPGDVISYSFISGTSAQHDKVIQTVTEWSKYANITFKQVDSSGNVRISFDPGTANWSYIGVNCTLVANPQPTMNLGGVLDATSLTSWERSIILHEFGHVLGLVHEHRGAARGIPIHLDPNAMTNYYSSTFGEYSIWWNPNATQLLVLDLYNEVDISNYADVDSTSIMLFPIPAEATLEKTETILVNSELSNFDKAYMTIIYPRQTIDASEAEMSTNPPWTLTYALSMINADSTVTSSILKYSSEPVTYTDTIRSLMDGWLVEKRMAVSLQLATPVPHPHPDSDSVLAQADSGSTPTLAPEPGLEDPLDVLPEYCTCDFERDYPRPPSDAPLPPVLDPFWSLDGQVNIGLFGNVTQYREQCWRETFQYWLQSCGLPSDKFNITNVFDAEKLKDSTASPRPPSTSDVAAYQVRVFFSELSTLPSWCCVGNTGLSLDSQSYRKQEEDGTEFATMCLRKIPTALEDLPRQFVNFPEHFSILVAVELHHAMGHLFGFHHEYERPPAKKQGFVYSAFDPASIMLYPHPAGIRNPSYNDMALLTLMYPDGSTQTSKFATALRAFKFANSQAWLGDAAAVLKARNTIPGTTLLQFLRVGLAANLKTNERLAILPSTIGEGQPGHDIGIGEGNGSTAKAVGFLLELVDNMNQFFPPGKNQLFTLQFPGNILDINSFAWDTQLASANGPSVKPTAVKEAEFRLVDQLYDLQDVVGGGNGSNLSIVYEQILNNLLPIFQSPALHERQSQIRDWLMKEVPLTPWIVEIIGRQKGRKESLPSAFQAPTPIGTIPVESGFGLTLDSAAQDKTLNRVELSELLMKEYLFAKKDWEMERDALIKQISQIDLGTPESRKASKELARKLSHVTAVRKAQLASKYSEAVVHGFLHTVREYMGTTKTHRHYSYMDILAPPVALQNAKDALHEASTSSADGSAKIYPVQMQPLDWFKGLSTNFQLGDLTSSPEVVRDQIEYMSQQVGLLQTELDALSLSDLEKVASKVESIQNALQRVDSALDSMTKNSGQPSATEDNLAKSLGISQQVNVAQANPTSASRLVSQVLATQNTTEVADSKQGHDQIKLKLDTLNAELKELQLRYQSATLSSSSLPEDTSSQELPTEPLELPSERTSGGSRWQSISFRSTSMTRRIRSLRDNNSRLGEWSCNLWLPSNGDHALAQASDFSEDTGEDIEIAYRATQVTVDRGRWFYPQLFKQSASFYKSRPNISWAEGPVGSHSHGLLPGYPVGFIIAKDIMVRVKRSGVAESMMSGANSSSAAGAEGILCFSSSTNSSTGFRSYSNGIEVRNPGPQIIGYIIEKTGPDLSQPTPTKLHSSFSISEVEYAVGEERSVPTNALDAA